MKFLDRIPEFFIKSMVLVIAFGTVVSMPRGNRQDLAALIWIIILLIIYENKGKK